MKEEKNRKELPFTFIEESRRNVANMGTDFRMTIMYHPNPKSFELRLYEKRFGLTDIEALNVADKSVIRHMRIDAATEVFHKFYEENFIKSLHPITHD